MSIMPHRTRARAAWLDGAGLIWNRLLSNVSRILERTPKQVPEGLPIAVIFVVSVDSGAYFSFRTHSFVRRFSSAPRAASAIRFARVSGRFAIFIHARIAFFLDGGNASKFTAAFLWAASAFVSSFGTSSASTSSNSSHEPSRLASSILARPEGCMRPAAIIRSMRPLLIFDHPVRARRGENHCMPRSSSRSTALLSIHPKQSASSTAASYGTRGRPVLGLKLTSQTPSRRP